MDRKVCKKFGSNSKSIALNILYMSYNTEEVRHAYMSKYNLKRENQVILLFVNDCEKWHYLAVKSFSAWLTGITSKHNGDFYCTIVFTHLEQKINLKIIRIMQKS